MTNQQQITEMNNTTSSNTTTTTTSLDGFQISITGTVQGTLTINYTSPQGQQTTLDPIPSRTKYRGEKRSLSSTTAVHEQPNVPANPGNPHLCNESCGTVEKAPILFEDPNHLLQREKKSKKLNAGSALINHLACVRAKILTRFPTAKGNDRPWHIELCSKFINEETIVRKAQGLHGTEIAIRDVGNYTFMGKDDRAFVLRTGSVEDYGMTHITIAFFLTPLTEEDRKWIFTLI